ncbi:E3 ubiquitin-protein ligase SH3RF1 [Frankliniella fusca]|uniref:E3 ubiquitin-protein ligase SH3RF1 n=1 Tax=Frankliniella fusca TaxID=407009 RepID=A0AAE1LK13_9NEOP|nr:E3 ubiquitin-protein ligase SH3RF1 [Frankliniella fusca]
MEDVLLECQVCFERYDSDSRRPKILSCGHTFCLSCLCASDNKCSNCRIPFRGSPMNLPDNFILLSATDNAPPPKKKAFWCLDCKKGADAECEDSHTICSMKKIISEQIGDLTDTVRDQLTKEENLLGQLVVKLAAVKVALHNATPSVEREVTAHNIAIEEIGKMIQSIPDIENNPKDDSLESLKTKLSTSKDRLPILEKKVQLLDMLSDCEIRVKPTGSETEWDLKINITSDEVSDDMKALFYLLYKNIGHKHFDFPESISLPCAGDAAAPLPTTVTPSPNGTCIVQVTQNARMLGHIAISVVDSLPPQKKNLIMKGLNGVKMYPKTADALTGSMRADVFLHGNNVKLSKGAVCIARSPLQPLSIFVQKPTSVPKTMIYVWGKVVENLALLESIVQNWQVNKGVVTLTSPRWA